MDPVTAGAAITGITSLAGGVMQSRGNNRATDAQGRATAEALAYQRQRDSDMQLREDQARREYQERYDQYLQQFYGVQAPDRNRAPMSGTAPAGSRFATPLLRDRGGLSNGVAPGATPTPGAATPAPAVPGAPPGPQGVPPLVPQTPQQPRTVADLAGWNDWNRYLGGRNNATASA